MKQNKKRRVALLFLKQIDPSIESLSAEAWNMFKHMTTTDIAEPLVINLRKKNMTMGGISIKTGISQRQVRYILDKNRNDWVNKD